LLVSLGGFALTVAASLVTGPAFDEERRIGAARHATELVRAVADFGSSALVSSSARGIYDELAQFGVLPGLLSGWLGEALARVGLDRLVATRLGWLLCTGLAPAAVYSIVVKSRGPRVAALAAAALLAMPRWTHAAALAREPAFVVSVWLLAIAAYLRSLPPPLVARRAGARSRFRWAAPIFAVGLGLGAAANLAALWVLPLIAIHHWTSGASGAWRSVRRGRAPLPVAMLWFVLLGPVVVLGTSPGLWRGGASRVAEWLFLPLAPTIEPILYHGGPVVAARDVPPGYAVSWLLATLPIALIVLAAGGGLVFFRDWIASRRGTRPRDRGGLGALVLLSLLAATLGPALTPAVLTRFPPRVEAALPFLAIAAAVALDRLAIRMVGERFAHLAALVTVFALVTSGLIALPTASASFGLLARGTPGAIASRSWTVGDGSEVASLARAIDAEGRPRVSVDAPEVPRSYWAMLGQLGRLRARVDVARPGQGYFVIVRGPRSPAAATVERGGAVLWSLSKQ
jgi:hypothetical protein